MSGLRRYRKCSGCGDLIHLTNRFKSKGKSVKCGICKQQN